MKIPTARQLPSGKWCVQLRIDGRSITITRDKEDQAIAEALAVKKGIVKAKAAKPKKKENKNRNSTRLVPIIPPLRAALEAAQRKSDYVVSMSPAGMFQQINRICEANNLPRVGIHGLRHSFASLAYHLNVPEKVAMEIGGWSNDQTMRKIYTHIAQQDVAAHAKTFTAFFDNQSKNANESANENEKVTDNQ